MSKSPSPMSTTATDGRRSNSQPSHPLDELIWAALTGPHATLSEGSGPIRRYHLDVAPFGASREYSESALAALGELVRGPEPLALVTPSETDAPKGLTAIRRTPIDQMILSDPEACGGRIEVKIERLTLADVPEMLALTASTNPGPFGPRTIQLGDYYGIHHDGVLVAMAGERLRMPGFTEISAVCVDPRSRGRGYAANLTRMLAASILSRSEIPILHVLGGNDAATALYSKLGFSLRRRLHLGVFARPDAGAPVVDDGRAHG